MTTMTTTPTPTRNKIAWPSVIWIGAFHVGALLAFLPRYFSWQAVGVWLVMHWMFGGVGICLCYHRLLTHRSFTPRFKWMEYLFAMVGCSASEGGPIGWVADHRRHHAHSDEPLDVHTPHEGFWWAHMMWFVTPEPDTLHTPEYYNRWAPDLNKDPVLRALDKWHFLFPLMTAGLMYALGGMSWLVWGSFLSTVTVLHSTWLVNSATHVWGYRSHQTRDDSTNLWWVAILTFGEGWHNNHHAYQTSARHGLRWWEVDMTYMAIRAMQAVGLARNVKLPKTAKATEAAMGPTSTPNAVVAKAKAVKSAPSRGDGEPELVGAVND